MNKQAPEDHKTKLPTWKRLLIGAGITLSASFLLFLALIWYLIASAPDLDTINVSPTGSSTYICDQNGKELRKLTLAASNRDIVDLDHIAIDLQNAIIAIEDSRFYEHGGIDIYGIARAFVNGITKGSFSEGASTITQQLIKNSVFTEWTLEDSFADRFRRKVQEQYLALQLEKEMSKEKILENYLNTINFGAGCYGVQAASRRYFGKNASELTLSEAAVLAAIPQNPSALNPIKYPDKNRSRQETILHYMLKQSYINESERDLALADDVYSRIHAYDESIEEETVYSWYEDALIDQVIDILVSELGCTSDQAYRAVYSGGLRIYSAQDAALQQICDEEFQNPDNFPQGMQFGIDYALSISDENSLVTHYGSDALRTWIRKTTNPHFDLMCVSKEAAQEYVNAFQEHVLEEYKRSDIGNAEHDTSDDVGDSNSNASDSAQDSNSDASDSTADSNSDAGDSTEDSNSDTSDSTEDSNSDARKNPGSTAAVISERLTFSPQPQASLVLIDQKTGFVRALVGGRGEKEASLTLNRASAALRQPGSTFKILTAYAPAIDVYGQTLATIYDNEPYEYTDGTPVSNWDVNDYSGFVTIREAITRSINVPAVKCITEITPQLGFAYAQKFGITTLHKSYESGGNISTDVIQPLALGGITEGVSNLELCGAYAAIANGGVYRKPKFFTKIVDRHGNVIIDYSVHETGTSDHSLLTAESQNPSDISLLTAESQNLSGISLLAAGSQNLSDASVTPVDNTRILQESTAFLLTSVMQDVVSSPNGTAYGTIHATGQPVAGKTGTTSNYKDIWFVGYTPYYTCSVWGGYDNNEDLPDGSDYHSYNKILWSAVMDRIHADLPIKTFTQPDSVVSVTLCSDSHLIARANACPHTYTEYFAEGTEPDELCHQHEPVPETEPIIIYEDLLDQFLTEEESETENQLESDSENELESETGSVTETESENMAESESENTAESESGNTAESESGNTAESESGNTVENESGNTIENKSGNTVENESENTIENKSGNTVESEFKNSTENIFANEGELKNTDSPGIKTKQSDTNSLEDLINRLNAVNMR